MAARPRLLRMLQGLRALGRERRGATMPIVVAAIIPVMGTLGAAVDTGRSYMAKSQLQAGVDAAALAGARAFARTDGSATSRTGQAESYFYGNFPRNYLGVQKLTLTTDFATNKGINVTTVTATAELPLMFMGLFGYTTQKLGAVARAELQPRPLEVMVVLDNTGSMKDNLPKDKNGVVKTRMTATKDAAKSFVDILYQGADKRPELAMGFISYDITVNVGALLTGWKPSSVRQLYGFNDAYAAAYGGWPSNNLLWKGCVFADDTVKNLNTTWSYQEPGAWDIDRTLPGEGAHPSVSPYFIPPFWVPNVASNDKDLATYAANPNSNYYKVSSVEPGFNLYKLDSFWWNQMLNTDAYNNRHANNPYREAFYDYYKGLNNGAANASDDVIVRKSDGGYYDYNTDQWNFATRTGTEFEVKYDRVPNWAAWKAATTYNINPNGGSTNSGSQNRTEPPSPNWQCPDAAYPVAYGRTRQFYKDEVIGQHNAAIYPANGTLHHAGLLWGYRLLVRDDVFKRDNPTNEEPKRALVFMTDGETALGTSQNGYTDRTFTFYGNYADSPISTSPSGLVAQSERRFSKTCAAIQAEKNPPKIYIISLVTKDAGTIAMFERCAPGHVYQTSDTATLKEAFDDIATELVDLHLTK